LHSRFTLRYWKPSFSAKPGFAEASAFLHTLPLFCETATRKVLVACARNARRIR